MHSRHFFNGLSGAAVLLALLVLLRAVWSPDLTQSLFLRAQKLENAGQVSSALSLYRLISDKHPDAFYAPRALLRQGDLLAAQGRQNSDTTVLRSAVSAYAKLARDYPTEVIATEALLDAGKIAAENLSDPRLARGFYEQLLKRSSPHSDDAATATLKLGRLAIDEHDGKTAQTLLQRVLQQWPRLSDQASESQFYLGVAYETLFKNQAWATRAYDATIERYPNSTWAGAARERLGLIIFSGMVGQKPPRRVLIETMPLPDNGGADGSLWSALRPVLASRGIEADDLTLRGWSLAPFYAGFDSNNPSRVVKPTFDAFENVMANAGLHFTVKSGGKPAEALRDLQDEIDAAHAPLVYYEEKGQGNWALCVGYDSGRSEVMLQSRGARFDTLTTKSFAQFWKVKSSLGGTFTLLSFSTPGTKARPAPDLTPTPAPSVLPSQTAVPRLLTAPMFVWQLPKLSEKDAARRTARRASRLLLRPRAGNVAFNIEGLDQIASQLAFLRRTRPESRPGTSPQTTPVSESPVPELSATASPDSTPDSTVGGEAESPYNPDSTPLPATPVPAAVPGNIPRRGARFDVARARALLGFFGEPARSWAASRREAALWCDQTANRLNSPNLKKAGASLRLSALCLEQAALLAPSDVADPPGEGDLAQLGEVQSQIERARDAERDAANALR